MKVVRAGLWLLLVLTCVAGSMAQDARVPGTPQSAFYDPYSNNPPGAPPNYNLIDSSYFQGVPDLPGPLENNRGGYYIYEDTAAGKWYIANHLYSRGNSLEQFHGSILAVLDAPPAPNVNVWSQGFELTSDFNQNDRWGWVKWPDSIAENLYEIWWDYTIDYAKPHDTGDYRDTIGFEIAGCAIDFNIWSSGHGDPFGLDQVYLGGDMTPLTDVPGFTDTYSGITDQYQVNDPEHDPNTSRFTQKSFPGASYNKNGTISPGTTYGDRYSGSWAYEGNGIQFATLFCPAGFPPGFVQCQDEDESDDEDDDDEEDNDDGDDEDDEDEENCEHVYSVCFGQAIIDTIVATDPNPADVLTMSLLSGPGELTTSPSTSPVTGIYELVADTSGLYTILFLVTDSTGLADTMEVIYDMTVDIQPEVSLPADTTYFFCDQSEVCIPVLITDGDCNSSSIETNMGSYGGSTSFFDQIGKISQLGGTVYQVGGGAPGLLLIDASDFVLPVNTQSGVSVTLPNFKFVHEIEDYGTFPSGSTPGNSADYLIGAPTDITFTTPGAGGPDGGPGDGSVGFLPGDWCIVDFDDELESCDGGSIDFIIFTNAEGDGWAEVKFYEEEDDDQEIVHTDTVHLSGGSAGSGSGGATLDLPDGVEFEEVKVKCLSGTFEVDALAVRTTPSSSETDICFDADTSGVYVLIVSTTDSCGNSASDTTLITVNLNRPPIADAGNDFTLFTCNLSEICFGVTFSDPDNNLDYGELFSGPGTLNGNQICFTPGTAGLYTFILRAVDSCGLESFDTVVVSVEENVAPVADDPSPVSSFLCDTLELCHTFTASDPDDTSLVWSLISGPGSLTPTGEYCFTPTGSGNYDAAVIVTDNCGAADTTSISYSITVNSSPVIADPGGPINLFQCVAEEICFDFTANDSVGGSLVWTLASGPGSLTPAGRYCFTPSVSGSYTAVVVIADSCGAADTASLTFNVTLNSTPQVSLGNDTSYFFCVATEVCLPYTVTDPNGLSGLIELMVSGYGSIDTAANEICFTPTVEGVYQFIVSVSDSCNATNADTIALIIDFGDSAVIDCPADTIPVSLCSIDTVCYLLGIEPYSATVGVSYGDYVDGELCFLADTTGTYIITVIASESCGADTCQLTFNVNIGAAAQIDCPDTSLAFICQADTVCIPVGVMGPGVVVDVSPIGNYTGGNICFPADTSGHYELSVVATTSCGTDSCLLVVDVEINSAPVAVDPPSPIDTFLCAAGQVCYQFAASDPDGGDLSWSRMSGIGTVSGSGLFCFDANTTGSYSVVAEVNDSCGASDTVSLTFNAVINTGPTIALENDTTFFMCALGLACRPIELSDAEGNIALVELLAGNGYIDTATGRLCFSPVIEGDYEFIVRVVDECGYEDIDTVVYTIDVNEAPLVDAGPDQTLFQCTPSEICWPVTVVDPDGNLASSELFSGVGTFDGLSICFTPTQSQCYDFVLKASDLCGEESYDTVQICVTLNTGPVADAGADQVLFLCGSTQVCWTAGCSDAEGNLSGCVFISGPGSYDGSSVCFTPAATGVYTFVLEATDACGLTDLDTAVIDITINSSPVCAVPNDTTIFLCDPTEVCLPAFATDIDGNLNTCQIISGPGSLSGGNWCYTPVAGQTVTVQIECLDSCGAVCQSQFTAEFIINRPPQIDFASTAPFFLCQSQEICFGYTASDPDDPQPRTITLVSGSGLLDEANSLVCFTPDSSGSYQFIINIVDECGVSDQDTIDVDVTLNSPPTVNAGSDQVLFFCSDQVELCWPVSCSDIDGNLTDCIFTGPGVYDGNQICTTPDASGSYLFILQAADACGEIATDTVVIDVTINTAPTIYAGDDISVFLCQPEEICFGYSVTDPDGLSGLTETMVSGYGAIDTAVDSVCFTPTVADAYEFILSATDSCGAVDYDTIIVNVTFGEVAQITCPPDTISVSLCGPDTVCLMLDVQPPTANVETSLGYYANGEHCFVADTSGIYPVCIIATESCGSDTCCFVYKVDIGQAAEITCGDPHDLFLCTPDTVCLPVTVLTPGATVDVSPIGYYDAGVVCFNADTAGHYELLVVATTECGSDSCTLIAEIAINAPPVAIDPSSPVDTFLCNAGQICYLFNGSDPEGSSLSWSRVSGAGTVDPSGLWCFDASASGSYSVIVAVSDSCGAADTTTLTYNVAVNSPPQVTLPNDTSVFQCTAEEICFPYAATDPDDNIIQLTVLPQGLIDTASGQVCFTPNGVGSYQFIVTATDTCGFVDSDTIVVMVQVNSPPVANAGGSFSRFLCEVEQVCWPAGCSDPDNNLVIDSCGIVYGPGSFDGNSICFTPDTSGYYTFVLWSLDECGLSDYDTMMVEIWINSAPVCNLPGDTSVFACNSIQLSLPVGGTDIDGNFDHCEIITGPGSIVGGNWVYTLSSDQTLWVKIMCLDSCGASCIDSFQVDFNLNSPPQVDLGDDQMFFLCATQEICLPVSITDNEGNLAIIEILDGFASYVPGSGEICFSTPPADGAYRLILKATDSCGAEDIDSVLVTIEYNSSPTVDLPPNPTVYLEQLGEVCLVANVNDVDDNLASVEVSPFASYNAGMICFDADTTGIYCIEITATDECGASATDTACINVVIDECIHVQIEKTHNSLQGQMELVNIYLNGSGRPLGGFDFLVSYDVSGLTPSGVTEGQLVLDCGWEYFTYRYGAEGTCSGCPSGLLRIIGMAEINNGPYHPGCFLDGASGPLATMAFLVSSDYTLECQYVPISFYWTNCGDNTVSSIYGDTLWVSRQVYEFEGTDITDYFYGFPGKYGAPNECLIGGGPGKPTALRCIDFTNGGVDIVCVDSIDARGDVNLNGLSNEVADAVVFTNYFIYGLSAFTVNVEGQIAATDVNIDGLTLTVADLVYLIRTVVGDELGAPKHVPAAEMSAEFEVGHGMLTLLEAGSRIGAIYLTLPGEVNPSLAEEATGMEIQYNFDGENTRVLIYNLNGKAFLKAGPVLNLNGARQITEIEVGSYDGYMMAARISSLPDRFELSQNYPNPFNPSTTINFALPVASDWELVIYNVLGQRVQRFHDKSDAGYVQIQWDAGRYSSGVYFYRLRAGEFSATRKMVLLK